MSTVVRSPRCGGSLSVVAFAIYPIAAALFRTADIPKRLIPATIALCAFTFTMTALPATPAPLPLWVAAWASGAQVGLMTLTAMRLRRGPRARSCWRGSQP